jgi:hypothetical protein
VVTLRFEHKQRNALCAMTVEGTRVVIHYGRMDGERMERTSERPTPAEAASYVATRSRHLMARGYVCDPPCQRPQAPQATPRPNPASPRGSTWSAASSEPAPAQAKPFRWLVLTIMATVLLSWWIRHC